jgi:putative hydrolase of HD superfamily
MQTILQIKKLYELKHVLRDNHVRNRIESVAEHSRSALILADYFLSTLQLDVDRLRVYELLMYHDVVEIETGDIPVGDLEARKYKKEKELLAMKKIKEDIPEILREKFAQIFYELEEKKTLESRFVHAIDKLDADLQAMEHPADEFG